MATWYEVQNYLVKECLLSNELHESVPTSVFYSMACDQRARLIGAAMDASIPQNQLDYLLEANADGSRFADFVIQDSSVLHAENDLHRCTFKADSCGEWLQISSFAGTFSVSSDPVDAAGDLGMLSSGGVMVKWLSGHDEPVASIYATHSAYLPALESAEDIFEYWLETALDAQHLLNSLA